MLTLTMDEETLKEKQEEGYQLIELDVKHQAEKVLVFYKRDEPEEDEEDNYRYPEQKSMSLGLSKNTEEEWKGYDDVEFHSYYTSPTGYHSDYISAVEVDKKGLVEYLQEIAEELHLEAIKKGHNSAQQSLV